MVENIFYNNQDENINFNDYVLCKIIYYKCSPNLSNEY